MDITYWFIRVFWYLKLFSNRQGILDHTQVTSCVYLEKKTKSGFILYGSLLTNLGKSTSVIVDGDL